MKTFSLPNDSVVAVHDIFDPLPDFIRRADTIFVDPPYNQAMLSNFSNRPGVELSPQNGVTFPQFSARLIDCIQQVKPDTLFIEMGKEYLGWWLREVGQMFRYVTFYNSTYYKKRENKCYIIHATSQYKTRRYKELEDMDEADIIAWVASNHEYECIGDLCMGKGLVGRRAYDTGKSFVGTELNGERLASLVTYIEEKESSRYTVAVPGTR
jgi:hypothetical protein